MVKQVPALVVFFSSSSSKERMNNNNNLLVQYGRTIKQLNEQANRTRQNAARLETRKRRRNNSPINSPRKRSKSPRSVLTKNDALPYNEMPFLQVRWLVTSWPKKTSKEKVTSPALQKARNAFHMLVNSGLDSKNAYRVFSRITKDAQNAYYRSEYERMRLGGRGF